VGNPGPAPGRFDCRNDESNFMKTDYIWTAAGTNIEVRFRKLGWVPPSEDPKYIKKWADWRALLARTVDDWQPERLDKKQPGSIHQLRFKK
jgi:hypothetical protein